MLRSHATFTGSLGQGEDVTLPNLVMRYMYYAYISVNVMTQLSSHVTTGNSILCMVHVLVCVTVICIIYESF